VTGRWYSPGIPASSTNKTDLHDITEILLKVALNTMIITINPIIETLPINSLVTVKIYSELSINKTYLAVALRLFFFCYLKHFELVALLTRY
jgi:hypothetical protein